MINSKSFGKEPKKMNNSGPEFDVGEVDDTIKSIVFQVTGIKIGPNQDNLDMLQIDSLAKLEIMTLLEKSFSLNLTEDITAQFTSISKISRIIYRSIQAKNV